MIIIMPFLDNRKEEQQEHPQEVLNSIKTYEKSIKRKSSTAKFMLVATTIRESDEVLESKSTDADKDVFEDDTNTGAASDKVSVNARNERMLLLVLFC